MTDTTELAWSADGVSLQTFAQNIETLGGRLKPPPMRGDDITLPYMAGQTFVPKVADAQSFSLGMWVKGCNPDGSAPTGHDAKRQFWYNWRALRSLLWHPERQFVLTKKFYIGDVLKSASGLAQWTDGMEPTMMGTNAAKFTVDIKMTDPYFYDDVYTTMALVNGDNAFHLDGDAPTRNVLLTLNGARNDIKIKNSTNAVQVEYNDNLLAGGVAHLDIYNQEATTTPSGAPTYSSNGKILHSGADQWLYLQPGDNVINLSSVSGTGATQIQGKGAWI